MGLISKPRPAASAFAALTLDDLLADLFSDPCFASASPTSTVTPPQPYNTRPCTAAPCPLALPAALPAASVSAPYLSPQQAWLAASAAAGYMAAAPPPPPPPQPPLVATGNSSPSGNSGSGSGSASGSAANAALPVKERRRPGKKPRAGRRFACPICNSTFSRKDNLATHARVHTGERPYSCGTCSRTFMWPSSARTHELTHTRVGRRRRAKPTETAATAAAAAVAAAAASAAAAVASSSPLVPAVPAPASVVADAALQPAPRPAAASDTWHGRPLPAPLPLAALGRGEDALLSLDGLMGVHDSGYELRGDGAAVTPVGPPAGESPMFGAGAGARLSVDDLVRHMEDVLEDGAAGRGGGGGGGCGPRGN